jgi:hypothetical protein
MADFDVGAISLSVPPASGVIQPYRPAVLVRNNGIHDALAAGSLRIYSPAGLLIFTTEIYSGVIAPGETKPALAVDYWTPPAVGRYQVIAYVSCINDQVEPNNSLPPCFVTIIPGEPPEPSTVPLHASQHEEGMSDEVNVDGLHGRLTDAQTPTTHKSTHQAAGTDQLDVTGLPGILADGQPIADHAQTHESLGGDRIQVDGLHGELYNLQKPKIHGNEKHDPNFASATELANHLADTTAVHAVAKNLEQTGNKGEASGYAGLDEQGHVPDTQLATVPENGHPNRALTLGSGWGLALPTIHAQDHLAAGTDPLQSYVAGTINTKSINFNPGSGETVLLSLPIPEQIVTEQLQARIDVGGLIIWDNTPAQGLMIRIYTAKQAVATLGLELPLALTQNLTYTYDLKAVAFCEPNHSIRFFMRLAAQDNLLNPHIRNTYQFTPVYTPEGSFELLLTAEWLRGGINSSAKSLAAGFSSGVAREI